MKTCIKCSIKKTEDSFYWAVLNHRRASTCKACIIKRSFAHKGRKFYKKKKYAKDRCIPFELTLEQFEKIRCSDDCFYCGERIEKVKTIDRINSQKGYSMGNVVLSCHRCNFIKSNLLPKDITALKRMIQVLKTAK